jgi:membrane protease subunit HflC
MLDKRSGSRLANLWDDAKAAAIYAGAFNQNAEFYSFYRSLEAYRQSFKSKNDVLVIEPNSDFFKYLKNSGRPAK